MVKRETIKQRNARVADLLAHYHEVMAQLRKLENEADGLKEQVREIDPGTYDGWEREDGTPREIMDQQAVKADYAKRRVEVPMTTTRPPLVVRPVATAASGTRRRS
jgi:hypothetical protein